MSLAMPLFAGVSLSMLVSELERFGVRVAGDAEVRVSDVRQDSRRVEPGDLFVARAGTAFDGARFVTEAVARGAVAILADENASVPQSKVPVIRVNDVRRALGFAAEAVHGNPTLHLSTVGVTGTNGKTTTAWLAQQAIDRAGGAAARLGTLGYAFRDDRVEDSLTTPEADDVSRFARRALDRSATAFVMETSSHALSQARVDALTFRVAAFTNLTQDHLDFHGTMDAYGAAKARLFTDLAPAVSVVNVDDAFGAALAGRAHGRVLRVGKSPSADVRASAVVLDARGIRARVRLPSGDIDLESRLAGAHNLENLLVALGIVEALGLDVRRAALGLAGVGGAPGRLERIGGPEDDVTVLVDYAHTPDALERVLDAVKPLTAGKVVCVFGCGGDRDPGKRPKMGAAVGARAHRAILTNDNPRTEDPAAIVSAIEPALRASGIPYEVVFDRASAIERAIVGAAPEDLVLIAGKGHEPYQIFGTTKQPFDDRIEARRSLEKRRSGGR